MLILHIFLSFYYTEQKTITVRAIFVSLFFTIFDQKQLFLDKMSNIVQLEHGRFKIDFTHFLLRPWSTHKNFASLAFRAGFVILFLPLLLKRQQFLIQSKNIFIAEKSTQIINFASCTQNKNKNFLWLPELLLNFPKNKKFTLN
jgi:hypothetical protein